MRTAAPGLQTFHDGWANYQRLLLTALRDLGPEQLALRAGPGAWSIWQLASHVAGARSYWLHDVLGEGDDAVREMFRVEHTTVPGLAIEDAGWEDDEDHARSAAEIVRAFEATWGLVSGCLGRWTQEDLRAEASRRRRGRVETFTREWVVWHLIEHDLHHGGEISLILGSNGLPAPDL